MDLRMREYNFEIRYVQGNKNVVADKLSRSVLKSQVITNNVIKIFLGLSKDDFRTCQRKHKWHEVIEHLKGGSVKKLKFRNILHNFLLEDGLLHNTVVRKDKGINFNLELPNYKSKL